MSAALTLVLSQPLLKGAGRKVNNAPLQIAQIRAEQTAWDFKQEVMESCFNVATAYWDLHAAQAALRAVSDMLPLLEETVSLQQKLFEAERVIEADVGKAVARSSTSTARSGPGCNPKSSGRNCCYGT